MADEKTAVKEEKKGFFTKVIGFFKRLPSAIARPFKNTWHEMKKVTWPTRQDWLKSTLIVLAFMGFMAVVIGLLDMGSGKLIQLFVNL